MRLSLRSLRSSSVSPLPSSRRLPAIDCTLNAIGPWKTCASGYSTDEPSKVSAAEPSPTLLTWSSSSETPDRPAPDTAW